MKIKKIMCLISVLCALSTFAFADEAKYNELLAKAKDYESRQMWVYSMSTYWDAILEQPQIAKEAYDSFNRIKDSYVDEFRRPTGKPGPGEYDASSSYEAWKKLCREYEIYWNEHSDEIFYVTVLKCVRDTNSSSVNYKWIGELGVTSKFRMISGLILNSKRYYREKESTEIPDNWPVVSMFKDSKTIPVVKFIGACNNKKIESPYKSTSVMDSYLNNKEPGTRFFRVSSRDMIAGIAKLSFPAYEQKDYYVAAWNNIAPVTDGEWESNIEVKIKILDDNEKELGTYTSKVSVTTYGDYDYPIRSFTFNIQDISQQYDELLKNHKTCFEVVSIVSKTKNSTAQVNIPDKSDAEIKFIDVKHTNGPEIKLYREGNDDNVSALEEYQRGDFFSKLVSAAYIGNGVKQPKKIQKNKYNFEDSECNEVEGNVFIVPLALKDPDSSGNGDFYTSVRIGNKTDKYTINNDNFLIWVPSYGRDLPYYERYLVDNFINAMNKRFSSDFKLGLTKTGDLCIFRAINDADAATYAEYKKAEEKRIVEEKEAEDKAIKSFYAKEFKRDMYIRDVVIPNGVKVINNEKFYYCTSLEAVTIPNSVKTIGYSAFQHCTSLRSINIPDSVTSIGSDAFYDCQLLREITFAGTKSHWMAMCRVPENVIVNCSDGKVANYLYNSTLNEINIPEGVEKIGYRAFADCKLLKSVTIPNSVKYISEQAFGGCQSLESITIPGSVEEIGSQAFLCCGSLKKVTISEGVKKIGDHAFEDCESLQNVTIPKTVKKIDIGAFDGCDNLQTINYTGSKDSWKNIIIYKDNKSNKPLLKAKINFDYK